MDEPQGLRHHFPDDAMHHAERASVCVPHEAGPRNIQLSHLIAWTHLPPTGTLIWGEGNFRLPKKHIAFGDLAQATRWEPQTDSRPHICL